MSRNLGTTSCRHCADTPLLEEDRRPITELEAGVYFPEYEGMLVAKALCPSCQAQYLAWCKAPLRWNSSWGKFHKEQFFDLSYRSSFNDEPGSISDLPKYACESRIVRLGPYDVAADPYGKRFLEKRRNVFEWDGMTHNMTEMAKWAGIYKVCWRPEELGITVAGDLVPFLEVGLLRLKTQPEEAKKYNPPNAWGNYEGFVDFVERYLAACREHPDATIRVSR